jgi:hypothetical protein
MPVLHPDDAIAAIPGDSAEVPKAMLEEAQRIVLRDGDLTRFGVVQAITLVAHEKNTDVDVRFATERLAAYSGQPEGPFRSHSKTVPAHSKATGAKRRVPSVRLAWALASGCKSPGK